MRWESTSHRHVEVEVDERRLEVCTWRGAEEDERGRRERVGAWASWLGDDVTSEKKNNDHHFDYLVLHPLFYGGFFAWMRFPFETWRLNVSTDIKQQQSSLSVFTRYRFKMYKLSAIHKFTGEIFSKWVEIGKKTCSFIKDLYGTAGKTALITLLMSVSLSFDCIVCCCSNYIICEWNAFPSALCWERSDFRWNVKKKK